MCCSVGGPEANPGHDGSVGCVTDVSDDDDDNTAATHDNNIPGQEQGSSDKGPNRK